MEGIAGTQIAARFGVALRTPVDNGVAGQPMPHRMCIMLSKDAIGDIDFGKIAANRETSRLQRNRRPGQAKLPTRRRAGRALR